MNITEQSTVNNLAPDANAAATPDATQATEINAGAASATEKTPEQVAADEKEARIKTEIEKEKHDIRRMKKFMQRAAQAEAERDALKAQFEQANHAPAQPDQGKPQRAQFADDASFVEALTDWKVEQKTAPLIRARETERATTVQSKFQEKESVVKAQIPDYEEVISEATDVIIPNAAVDAILTSDYGPQLRYYLAKHPDEAASLNGITPGAAARKIGTIEAKLSQEAADKKTKQTATPPPPPINPPSSGGDSGKLDPNKLSDKDWFQREYAEQRKPRK